MSEEKAHTFKPGDVVCHKSNPQFRMVVVATDNGEATCQWFVDGKPSKHAFPHVALMIWALNRL